MRAALFIGFIVSSVTAITAAHAMGEGDKVALALVAYSGNWNPRPTAIMRLAWELDKRTSVETVSESVAVRLSDEAAMRKYPLLIFSGDSAFSPPDEGDVARLRRYIQSGGFLLIDSAEARPGGGFDQSVRALVKRIFPREALAKLPDDHVVYKSFYLLQAPVGRVAVVPYLEAVIHDGRAAIIYSQNDLQGAWARDNFGEWEHSVYPGGERQREMAFRLGVNLAMYALCLDYKADQVHVPFILRRRQWRP